tara:strand:- start:68155 stop:70227 length:2073 start_codon:yes stop_codon:yes gene_type:complete
MSILLVISLLVSVVPSTSTAVASSQHCSQFYRGFKTDVLFGISPTAGVYTSRASDFVSVKKAIERVNEAVSLSHKSHKKVSMANSRNLFVLSEQWEPLASSFAAYENARFVVADKMIDAPTGTVLYKNVQFGYKGVQKTGPYLDKLKKSGFKNYGTLTYILADAMSGKILEVGGIHKDLLAEFRLHLLGREVQEKELRRYSEVYKMMIEHFQRQADGRVVLAEFNRKRGWPEGFAENAGLFYLENVQALIAWARQNQVTQEELVRMGVVRRNYTQLGTRNEYSMICSHSIMIPYFSPKGDVVKLKARQLKKTTTGKKYLDFSEDKTITNGNQLHRRLFNSAVLNHIQGKPVIITEGEIKSLVATRIGKIDTVAIPGISQFEDDMAHALVAAKASEYIVVLDRDPEGKALMNLDHLTDSQRAAYVIAAKLEEAGAPVVKVGIIPDSQGTGSKIGLDDMILQHGPDSVKDLVKNAKPLKAYAEAIHADQQIAENIGIQTILTQALRVGHLAMKNGLASVDANDVRMLEKFRSQVLADFENHLATNYPGSRNLRQPTYGYKFIPPQTDQMPNPRKFKAQGGDPELSFGRKDFLNAILLFEVVDSKSSLIDNDLIVATNQKTREQLKVIFPNDEYGFAENVTISKSFGGAMETIQVPLLIYRLESHKVVALARPSELTKQEESDWDSDLLAMVR